MGRVHVLMISFKCPHTTNEKGKSIESGITLRMRLRSSGFRSASLRAKGRRCRWRVEASGTPVIDSNPGPSGPRASMTPLLISFSLSASSNEDDEDIVEHRSKRSE